MLTSKGVIMKKAVLSKKLIERAAIRIDKTTLVKINEEAGFGPNFICRLWGRDNIELSTVDRIANVLGCSACDMIEEVEVTAGPVYPVTPGASATARTQAHKCRRSTPRPHRQRSSGAKSYCGRRVEG